MILGREEEFAELAQALADGLPGARERVEVLAHASNAISAACACHVLADYQQQHGQFTEALRTANSALTRLASAKSKGREVEKLRAMLVVMRGIAYAGLGQVDEALEVHDELLKNYPQYVDLREGAFRVCLLAAVRLGELDDALQMVEMQGDKPPVSARDAFVCDALRAVVGGGSAEDRATLRARLAEDAALATWLGATAPSLVEKLQAEDGQAQEKIGQR